MGRLLGGSAENLVGRTFVGTMQREMPPRLLVCVGKFGEGDQSHEALSPSAPSLLSRLDAIEGKQLLRACRTHLRALSYLQRLGSFA